MKLSITAGMAYGDTPEVWKADVSNLIYVTVEGDGEDINLQFSTVTDVLRFADAIKRGALELPREYEVIHG